ncbi:MAG: hypothetical protein IKG27_04670 [Bacilli bacterium]|nr:hypothetical protein [Bacilli bacterium]
MNNLLESVKRFFKNKNTVTIVGVIVILVLLYIGYSSQIKQAVNPVSVVVATETIQPRTEITSDMVQTIDMPNISISDNVYTSKNAVIGKYSNVNSVIPKGSMFYKEMVIEKKELPDAAFTKVKTGEVVYNFPVNMESTYGNSIFPGTIIDIYMKVGNGSDEKVVIGKLLENIEVLAVKDSSGRAVFENTEESRTPAMMIFGLPADLNNLLKAASYLDTIGVELYPVPHSGTVDSTGATRVSTEELKDYIEAHSISVKATESEKTVAVDKLVPTITESGGSPNSVTINFPNGCGSKYTCTYAKDGGKTATTKKTSVVLKYTDIGTLIATVTEKDGTPHTLTTSIPQNEDTDSTTGNVG